MTESTKALRESLEAARPLYFLPNDPLAEEVLVPGFKSAQKVDCMAGFFSSHVLAALAPGLASYIQASENSFRLIISPILRAEDQAAIEAGLKSEDEVANDLLQDLVITEDLIERHTLMCLTWLLRQGRIEIKVALMQDALFHVKAWLFEADDQLVAVHGSSNPTSAGIKRNIEQMSVSRSWQDPNQQYTAQKFREQFDRFWGDSEDHCRVIPMPDAVERRLLRNYGSETPPTEEQLQALFNHAGGVSDGTSTYDGLNLEKPSFAIPDWLRYEDGPYAHQGQAVEAWIKSGLRGVLEMATGSGKTITAMIGAYRLYEKDKPLLIVVAAPYVPLISQWCDEIEEFGLKPINLTTLGGVSKRSSELQRIKRRFRAGLSDVEIVVVSHDTLCTADFSRATKEFDCCRLLIADEAHNLGRPSFIGNPPEHFEARLGLSATPVRQYDEEGTDSLFDFFGPVVFRFTLEEAIGTCLVEYDYFLHPVYLTATEMDDWYELTGKIKQNAWRGAKKKPDDYLSKLLRDRRALLETASKKISMLKSLLDLENLRTLKHTLIYTSDKGPSQLEAVNSLLDKNRVLFHQLTASETADNEKTKGIIRSFQNSEIQVLTAKRVLDEGVNIPQICKAFILASTTIERQWVQRRGRLLRTCKAIGKDHSVIHDIVTLPPHMDTGLDDDARQLVLSELLRAQEFAKLARNAGRLDGPLPIIDRMVTAVYG